MSWNGFSMTVPQAERTRMDGWRTSVDPYYTEAIGADLYLVLSSATQANARHIIDNIPDLEVWLITDGVKFNASSDYASNQFAVKFNYDPSEQATSMGAGLLYGSSQAAVPYMRIIIPLHTTNTLGTTGINETVGKPNGEIPPNAEKAKEWWLAGNAAARLGKGGLHIRMPKGVDFGISPYDFTTATAAIPFAFPIKTGKGWVSPDITTMFDLDNTGVSAFSVAIWNK